MKKRLTGHHGREARAGRPSSDCGVAAKSPFIFRESFPALPSWTIPQRTTVPGVRAIPKSDRRGIGNLSIRPIENPGYRNRTHSSTRIPSFGTATCIARRPRIPSPSVPTR